MSDYGATDVSTTPLLSNQFPVSAAYVPNDALRPIEGGAVTTDGAGKKSAPVRVEIKDGSNITQGAKADSAATDNTSSWSVIALLKGIIGKLLTSIAVTQSGLWTVTANSQAATTPTVTQVASSASDGSLLASNSNRKGVLFMNDSTSTLYLLYGTGTSSTTNYSVKVGPGVLFEDAYHYTGGFHGIWSSANGYVYVTELT